MRYSLYIGRFQPFHDGHEWCVRHMLENGKKVCIAIMDIHDDKPEGSMFENLFTRFPPCGLDTPVPSDKIFTYCGPCVDRIPYRIDFPTTNGLLVNLHLVLSLLYMAHNQY